MSVSEKNKLKTRWNRQITERNIERVNNNKITIFIKK